MVSSLSEAVSVQLQDEYRQRRERLMAQMPGSTAIFRSAPLAVMHHDVEYPFRQDSDFFYLTGFNEPEAVAVLAPHHEEHRFVLFVQPKEWEKEVWSGYRIGVEEAKALYGADEAYPIGELPEKLPQYLAKADRLYYHLGIDERFNQTILKQWQSLLRQYPKKGFGPTSLEDPMTLLHPLRLVKSEAELALMRKAIAISVEAHHLAWDMAKPGIYEYEIQAEMERLFRRRGGVGPAYPSIVASGANACILHYIENSSALEAGDLLLIDAGCSYGYYNGDITRTYPVGGKYCMEQRVIYEIVLESQRQAIAQIKPGNPFNAVHDTALQVLVEGMIELGFLVGEPEELIKENKYKPYYMHRTSHWLGLDVHDVGAYKQNEEEWQVLQPGQVLTVEPGLYIAPLVKPAEDQPEVPQQWRGIGIRIEDDILVTETGCEVLTAGIPKMPEELEGKLG